MDGFYHINPVGGSGGGGGGGKGGGGGGTSHVAQEDPNTLQSNSIARTIHFVSTGPCVGLADGAKSIFFDNTALQASNGIYNFSGVTWGQRTGEPDQDYIAGFSSVATSYTVNTEVKTTADVIRTLSGPIDACRITASLPYLAFQDKSTGDLLKTTVSFTLSKRQTGTSTWIPVHEITYNDKCVSVFQESFRIELGGTPDWDIKFTRNTEDSTESNLQNKTTWAYTAALTDGKFIYPNCGLVYLSVDAKSFGNTIPNVAIDWKGLIVKIPSNYNPTTRVYTGVWDGTFTTGWTDNPAWVLYALLTDADYGLGQFINEDQVDKYALYEIAEYCDGLVPNGFGGTEPRYTFNYQFTAQTDAHIAVQMVASCFNGLVYWASGQIMFFADMPTDSVKPYSEANIIGKFTYEGVALSARHSVCLVTWFDPEDMCNQAIEMVQDADMIAEFGWREVSVVDFGCISRGQAHRRGRKILDTEKNATETVNYNVAWDSCGLVPGDVVNIYDASYSGCKLGGRITAKTTTSITTDSPITISDAGRPYTLRIVEPTGTMVTRTLTNGNGSASVLTFNDALSALPIDGSVWGVTTALVSPRPFRVMSVRDNADGTYAITGIQYDPTKYARVDSNIILDPISYTRYNTDKPSAPTGIAATEYMYRYNLTVKSAATITWTPAENSALVRGYEVQVQKENGDWRPLGEIAYASVDLRDIDSGAHYIRVRAISFTNVTSDWFTKYFVFFGLAEPPADVQNFAIHVLGNIATLLWDANTELDLSHYKIKFAPVLTGALWSSSVDLLPQVSGVSAQVASMIGTYLIKAVDMSGNESANAAAIITSVAALADYNAVAALSDYPNWSGTHDGTYNSAGALRLDSAGSISDWPTLAEILTIGLGSEGVRSEGAYLLSGGLDLGGVFVSRLSAMIDAYGLNVTNIIGNWPSLASVATLGAADSSEWNVQIQIRTTDDDPAASPTWSEWKNLVTGDYQFRAIDKPKIILTSGNSQVTPVVNDVTVTIDMPDRVAANQNVAVPVGGLAVVFSPAFRATPAIAPTMQNGASGDKYEYLENPSATGFTIRFKDSGGNAVARTMDWIAKGYGYAA